MSSVSCGVSAIHHEYAKSIPQRFDLFKHLYADTFFFIDFDSLLLTALNIASIDWAHLQSLHVIYHVELFLKRLIERKARFSIIEFQHFYWVWQETPSMSLLRECCMTHLKHHCASQGIDFVSFPDMAPRSKNSFKQYFIEKQPEFMVMSDAEEIAPLENNKADTKDLAKAHFRGQCIYLLQNYEIPVVFASRILFKEGTAVGFVWTSLKGGFSTEAIESELRDVESRFPAMNEQKETLAENLNGDVRHRVFAHVAKDLLHRNALDWKMHLFIYHIAALEVQSLSQRSYKLTKTSIFMNQFFEEICHKASSVSLDMSYDQSIADLFDKRLFMKICVDILSDNKPLDSEIASAYDSICTNLSIPAILLDIMESERQTVIFEKVEEEPSSHEILEMNDDDSPLANWASRSDVLKRIDECYTAQDNLSAKRENFFRRVHDDAQTLFEKPYDLTWKEKESRSVVKASERGIMITNTYERVKQDVEKRKIRRNNLEQEFKAMEFRQGMSTLTDFISDCQNTWKQYEREIRRIPEGPDVAPVMFNSAVGYYELIMETYKFLISEAERLWVSEIDTSTSRKANANPAAAATMFQLIHKAREAIENNAEYITTDSLRKKTKHYLRDLRDRLSILGLKDNVKVWEEMWKRKGIQLPVPSLFIPDTQSYYVKLSSARFQLSAMSERLDRPQSAGDRVEPSRVPFNPDKWQADLLDIVDKRESAIVCTPTSSGKTFVSFYCIKLSVSPNPACHKDNAPGLVVYVSPTKPLLRQALASIYAKYQAKKYEMGWNVYGVLEDYAFMVEKCQALVTIPEAFEQLLLSSHVEDQALVQRIQYVIFDEIHSIDDLRSGSIWERLLVLCRAPFIALSATISNAEALARWLQSVQDHAREQHETRTGTKIPEKIELSDKNYAFARRFKVHLIPKSGEKIHRWSDLAKYCFRPIQHYPNFTGRTKVYNANGMLDSKFHNDSVLPLNPLSLFTLKQLQEEGSFPKDMIFLPKEVLALYDIIKSNCRKKTTPEAYEKITTALEPDEYFKTKNPLITQSEAREYEELLLNEFMSWIELSKTNKEYKRLCVSVLNDSGAGINVMLPPLTTKLYNALSAAQEGDDDVLDHLYPDNFFRHEKEPSIHSIRLHQYLLTAYLCQWELEKLRDVDSPFLEMLKEVLDDFEATCVERLPYPLCEYVSIIKKESVLPEKIDSFMDFIQHCVTTYTDATHVLESAESAPITKLALPRPSSIDYAKEFLMELLVMLNTREMLPAIVFTLDISDCEDMATRLCEQLEASEVNYRHSDEFNTMVNEVEQLKKQKQLQEKTRSGKIRQSKSADSGDADGERREKNDFRVDKDEFQEIEDLVREIPPILPFFSFAKYGAGEDAAKVDELISQNLGPAEYWNDFERKIVRCIQRGIGIHHRGLPNKIQALVEHLFRTQNIGVIVSTATLALGIHSPCRSVVIAGDNVELNPTQFRQMSGRAGRRGIDLLGNVFFLGIPFRKIKRLLTSKLQVLRGHRLTDPTNMLQMTDAIVRLKQGIQKDSQQRKKTFKKEDQKEVAALFEEDIERVWGNTLVESFLDRDRTFTKNWVAHTKQLMQELGLTIAGSDQSMLDSQANMYCTILLKCLNAYRNVRINPLNFAFLAALRYGALHSIARQSPNLSAQCNKNDFSQMNTEFVQALCALTHLDEFGFPLEIHRSVLSAETKKDPNVETNSVTLPPLAELGDGVLHDTLKQYSKSVIQSYVRYVKEILVEDEDRLDELPFSQISYGKARSSGARCAFSALSGRGDDFTSIDEFVRCIPYDINLEGHMLPAVDFIDHGTHMDGNVLLNACAYDLLRYGAQKVHGKYKRIALRDQNGLSFGLSWNVLDQFRSIVFTLTAAGQSLAPASHRGTQKDQHNQALRCTLHNEPIEGMAFKCFDCAKRGISVFLCEKCGFQSNFRCPNERIEILQSSARGAHEFSPYVEDDFTANMEHVCSMLEARKEMCDCGHFDPWHLSYARHKLQVRKDKVQCALRCGTVNVSEMTESA